MLMPLQAIPCIRLTGWMFIGFYYRTFYGLIFEMIALKLLAMNSINKNQEEENYQDLLGEDAILKIKELTKKSGTCFFCTNIKTDKSFSARPMSLQKADDEGNLWFLSAADSNLNQEMSTDPKVQLLFQGSEYSDFLNLYGTTTMSRDMDKIEEFWNPMLKTWFTEGKEDPRITVIKFTPQEGYYWDTKNNIAVGFIKRMIGAAIGKTMDDSIEGEIIV
jgi:general stress protein 26